METYCFSSLLDIDKITRRARKGTWSLCFSSLLDIDKITPSNERRSPARVLVLCWILIKLHFVIRQERQRVVLVLCWILIKLHKPMISKAMYLVLVLCWILIKLHVLRFSSPRTTF